MFIFLKYPQCYCDPQRLQEEHSNITPRLFECSNQTGRFLATEITNFNQTDLDGDDIMLLDIWDMVRTKKSLHLLTYNSNSNWIIWMFNGNSKCRLLLYPPQCPSSVSMFCLYCVFHHRCFCGLAMEPIKKRRKQPSAQHRNICSPILGVGMWKPPLYWSNKALSPPHLQGGSKPGTPACGVYVQ